MKWLEAIYNKAPKDLKHIIVHGFRHTFASLLNPYIKPSDVQAILGHETVEMTLNIYSRYQSEQEKSCSIDK